MDDGRYQIEIVLGGKLPKTNAVDTRVNLVDECFLRNAFAWGQLYRKLT